MVVTIAKAVLGSIVVVVCSDLSRVAAEEAERGRVGQGPME